MSFKLCKFCLINPGSYKECIFVEYADTTNYFCEHKETKTQRKARKTDRKIFEVILSVTYNMSQQSVIFISGLPRATAIDSLFRLESQKRIKRLIIPRTTRGRPKISYEVLE